MADPEPDANEGSGDAHEDEELFSVEELHENAGEEEASSVSSSIQKEANRAHDCLVRLKFIFWTIKSSQQIWSGAMDTAHIETVAFLLGSGASLFPRVVRLGTLVRQNGGC